MFKRNIVVSILLIVLVGFAVYKNGNNANQPMSQAINTAGLQIAEGQEASQKGSSAPSFSLTGLDGKSYNVGGSRDKLLLVNFWASWCGPCRTEAPDLVQLYNKYKDKMDLYAVNVSQGDSMRNIQAFVDEFKFPFPVLLDKEGTVASAYRILAIPTSFLIDKNGKIVEIFNVLPPKELEKKFRSTNRVHNRNFPPPGFIRHR
ncbi:TlpA disulfide reductase family protein [Paenibacillus larvae]|nr:TlpA disulfide reductase family protein [Paenibacillus larvae]MDT2240531.1 TlpA disulfide reductase family protein [Paenibacillus larvae]